MLTIAELAGFATRFAAENPGVQAVSVLSTDGLLLAGAGMDPDDADRLAAISSGLISLALNGSMSFDLGETTHVLVAYGRGNLLVCAVNDRCVMTVLTEPGAMFANVLFEMGRFAEAHGDAISPGMRSTVTALAQS
jgi:hypothetical protein